MTFVVKRNKDNKYLNLRFYSKFTSFEDMKDFKFEDYFMYWESDIDEAKEFTTMSAAVNVIHYLLKGKSGEYSVMRVVRT